MPKLKGSVEKTQENEFEKTQITLYACEFVE